MKSLRHHQGRSPAIFLDRDGVVNVPPKTRYVTRWSQFRFLPGVLSTLRQLTREGRTLVILSNQAGVGRAVFRGRQLREITRNMLRRIEQAGGRIQAVYYCTHPPEARCSCRKPRTGLIRRACREHPIDLKRSVVVGDNLTDIQMGRAAGCRTLLVLTGATDLPALRSTRAQPDRVAPRLSTALPWLLRQTRPCP